MNSHILSAVTIHDKGFYEHLDKVVSMIGYSDCLDMDRYDPCLPVEYAEARLSQDTLISFMSKGNNDRALSDANKIRIVLGGMRGELELAAKASFRASGLICEEDDIVMSGNGYYPENGYMGWHTNRDQDGVRIYCNWASEGGKSGLHYFHDGYDSETRILYDSKGWNIRLFSTDYRMPFWHGVFSQCHRVSVGFRVIGKQER